MPHRLLAPPLRFLRAKEWNLPRGNSSWQKRWLQTAWYWSQHWQCQHSPQRCALRLVLVDTTWYPPSFSWPLAAMPSEPKHSLFCTEACTFIVCSCVEDDGIQRRKGSAWGSLSSCPGSSHLLNLRDAARPLSPTWPHPCPGVKAGGFPGHGGGGLCSSSWRRPSFPATQAYLEAVNFALAHFIVFVLILFVGFQTSGVVADELKPVLTMCGSRPWEWYPWLNDSSLRHSFHGSQHRQEALWNICSWTGLAILKRKHLALAHGAPTQSFQGSVSSKGPCQVISILSEARLLLTHLGDPSLWYLECSCLLYWWIAGPRISRGPLRALQRSFWIQHSRILVTCPNYVIPINTVYIRKIFFSSSRLW